MTPSQPQPKPDNGSTSFAAAHGSAIIPPPLDIKALMRTKVPVGLEYHDQGPGMCAWIPKGFNQKLNIVLPNAPDQGRRASDSKQP